MRRRMALIALAGLVALVGAACGGGGTKAATGGSQSGAVQVTLKDFGIAPNPSAVKAGQVTFNIDNNGPSQHEFVVIKSDLAPTQLPMTQEEGVPIVDEEATGLEGIGEKEDINAGTSTVLSLNLTPGKYLLICNLPAHFKLGMVSEFTVTA